MKLQFYEGYRGHYKWVHVRQTKDGYYEGYDVNGHDIAMELQAKYRYCWKCHEYHQYERKLLSKNELNNYANVYIETSTD